ncbi:hypothetical protein [Microbulbifer sp. GL-2]|uniref:hypothetical protein n=1 Tax=Microbulbifer sp. GL-2 TaxID=2591606 RepID=UPI00116281E4|nr:hypothetical protein [Microbulbifer sp. GL-2]BBM00229.1 hypothetical protein GL2_03030 [Microbulbifer sp. GL-2]
MFQLEKSSLFFEGMAKEHPDLVQNIEIVHENKLVLDESYHTPKYFILNLNNSLRSLLFFIENSIKNSPDWLRESVKTFREQNQREYEILKRLRDVSAHQALVFPAESIITCLYRIRSSQEYVAKIGTGDLQRPGDYSWDLAMKDTDEVFHDLLVFHSMAFMDLEHCALNECLGITRKWFFHVKFSNKANSYDEVVDIYELLCQFSMQILDSVCLAYAEKKSIQFNMTFYNPMKEFNCVNTLLEIDLYPSLFSEWWKEEISPLNYGVRLKKYAGESIKAYDDIHYECYKNLCDSKESYKKLLTKYRDLPIEEYLSKENLNEFHSFIYFNHWHFKSSFKGGLMKYPVKPSEIMHLQRLGKIFLSEHRKEKLCTIASTGRDLKKQLGVICEKI